MAASQKSSTFFPSAIADMYSRGIDVSRDNPWAIAASAFPAAQAVNPGITMEELVTQVKNYFTPQPAPKSTPRPPAVPVLIDDPTLALQALEGLSPGEAGPVGMSDDTSLGGRAALATALESNTHPATIALGLMAALAGPLGPVVSAGKKAMMMHNLAEIDAAMGVGPPGSPGPTGGPPGTAGPPGSPAPGTNVTIDAVPVGAVPGNLGQVSTTPSGEAPAPGPGIGDVSGVPGGTGPGGAPGAAGPGSEGAPADGGAGASGPSGEGESSGSDFRRGGVVKDRQRRKGGKERINAHQGEFVVNRAASKAFRPELEALNALIPPEALDSLVEKGRKFFDAANRR